MPPRLHHGNFAETRATRPPMFQATVLAAVAAAVVATSSGFDLNAKIFDTHEQMIAEINSMNTVGGRPPTLARPTRLFDCVPFSARRVWPPQTWTAGVNRRW